VAAAIEVENGVENLWKHGKVGNRRYYPDFGHFVPINEIGQSVQQLHSRCFYHVLIHLMTRECES
jgi:hypothetical protein